MQTLIPFTAHWFMTRAMLIACKACNCACRKHESTWIVYNYSITLSSEGEMILWQANVTGIKDQRRALIEIWVGLNVRLGNRGRRRFHGRTPKSTKRWGHISPSVTSVSKMKGILFVQALFSELTTQTFSDIHQTCFVSEHQVPAVTASTDNN